MSEQDFSPAPKSGGCWSRISAQLQRNLQAPWGRCGAFPPALPHPSGAGKWDIQRNLLCRNGIGQSRICFGAFPLFPPSPVSRLPKYPIVPGNPSDPLKKEETQWKVSKESLFFGNELFLPSHGRKSLSSPGEFPFRPCSQEISLDSFPSPCSQPGGKKWDSSRKIPLVWLQPNSGTN